MMNFALKSFQLSLCMFLFIPLELQIGFYTRYLLLKIFDNSLFLLHAPL